MVVKAECKPFRHKGNSWTKILQNWRSYFSAGSHTIGEVKAGWTRGCWLCPWDSLLPLRSRKWIDQRFKLSSTKGILKATKQSDRVWSLERQLQQSIDDILPSWLSTPALWTGEWVVSADRREQKVRRQPNNPGQLQRPHLIHPLQAVRE